MARVGQLKRCGDIAAIGAGVNNLGDIKCMFDTVLDFFSLSQRYTLAEQTVLTTGERSAASKWAWVSLRPQYLILVCLCVV